MQVLTPDTIVILFASYTPQQIASFLQADRDKASRCEDRGDEMPVYELRAAVDDVEEFLSQGAM